MRASRSCRDWRSASTPPRTQGALDGAASTLAVVGTGLDRVYPARNRDLAHRIAERGGLVSEFPPGTPPRETNFPRRNRLISGLARGVLVVEAALASGSLITARYAGEQGREVFAIPGSIHSPLSKGCHKLIREGAKLVETAQHVLEELGMAVHPGPDRAGPVTGQSAARGAGRRPGRRRHAGRADRRHRGRDRGRAGRARDRGRRRPACGRAMAAAKIARSLLAPPTRDATASPRGAIPAVSAREQAKGRCRAVRAGRPREQVPWLPFRETCSRAIWSSICVLFALTPSLAQDPHHCREALRRRRHRARAGRLHAP